MTQADNLLLEQTDHAIKAGQGRVARRILRSSDLNRVPRAHRSKLANIARRADLPNLAVSLLNPLVRPSTRKKGDAATDVEKAEYAAALTSIGAADEAIEVLGEFDSSQTPAALLYHAFALFGSWDYAAAIPLLESYVQSSSLSEYERLVGRVNLAAALVHTKCLDRAEPMLIELKAFAQKQGHRLLLGNVLEIWAQAAIHAKDWKLAERLLAESRATLASSESLGEFFVKKWEVILSALRSDSLASCQKAFDRLRQEALQWQHWETLRDLDFFTASISRDAHAALHVYAGTPFAAFRSRLLLEIPFSLDIPSSYLWRLGAKARPTHQISLIDGRNGDGEQILEVGQVMHRLLRLLASDFYRPMRVPTLFSRLFPGEHYHPIHSSMRVHQAMKRLRTWMDRSGLPIAIEEFNGFYSLKGQRVEIVVPTDSGKETPERLVAQQLKARFPDDEFGVQDVRQALGTTERTAQRILRELLSQGLVVKVGKGRATSYRF